MMQATRHQLGSGLRGTLAIAVLLVGQNATFAEETNTERKRQVIPRLNNPSFGRIITIKGQVSVRSISTRSPINTSHPSIVSSVTVGDQTIVIPKPDEDEAGGAEAKAKDAQKPEKPATPVTKSVRRAYVGDY